MNEKKNMFEFPFLTSTVRKFSKLINKNPTTNLSTYFSAVLSYWKHCFVSWYWRFSHSFRSFSVKKLFSFLSMTLEVQSKAKRVMIIYSKFDCSKNLLDTILLLLDTIRANVKKSEKWSTIKKYLPYVYFEQFHF